MFNDKYGLTRALLEGRKTMTRRSVPEKLIKAIEGGVPGFAVMESKYKVGEVVAVAQSYGTILDELEDPRNFSCMEHWESKSGDRGKYAEMAMYSPGGTNKMFVLAEEMPHQIRITNVRVERLQDISDEDSIKEGIEFAMIGGYYVNYNPATGSRAWLNGETCREAFASLIDKVSGKGTWESNPWVFVYEFELVK